MEAKKFYPEFPPSILLRNNSHLSSSLFCYCLTFEALTKNWFWNSLLDTSSGSSLFSNCFEMMKCQKHVWKPMIKPFFRMHFQTIKLSKWHHPLAAANWKVLVLAGARSSRLSENQLIPTGRKGWERALGPVIFLSLPLTLFCVSIFCWTLSRNGWLISVPKFYMVYIYSSA